LRRVVPGKGGGPVWDEGAITQRIGAVTVYCSSSNDLRGEYLAVATEIGSGLARSGRTLVYGGGRVGLMGAASKACREGGGRVVGIITERLKQAEQLDPENHENIVVGTMRERKALLETRGDAMMVLPGGLGTLEEFFEILVGRLLGEHAKPIIVVNSADPDAPGRYYDPLIAMFDHMIRSRFARRGVMTLFDVCDTAEEALARLDAFERRPFPSEVAQTSHLMPTPPPSVRNAKSAAGARG